MPYLSIAKRQLFPHHAAEIHNGSAPERTGVVVELIAHKPNDESEIEIYEIPTPAVANVIDTNGAGDNYSGAFLYALSQHYSLPECGRLASEVAAQVIQQFGPRLSSQEYQDISRRVLTM